MINFDMGYATKPGEIILDYLDFYGFSQKWLAERIGCTEKHICKLVSGEAPISADIAVKLSTVIGSSADFWLSLEDSYKIYKASLAQKKQAEREVNSDAYNKIPYSELVKMGWIKPTGNSVEKVLNLYGFLNITSLDLVLKTQSVAFRKTDDERVNDYAVAVWLQKGENDVKQMRFDADYSERKLKDSFSELLDIAYKMPKDFFKKTVDVLAECGVILIAEKYLKGTYINGATRWIGNNPVIQLSDRGKSDDRVWFTLFHEIGHILKHGKKEQFLNMDKNDKSKKEKEADDFASETLINHVTYESFLKKCNNGISKEKIVSFSDEHKISPSILVGRLKYDRIVEYSMFSEIHRKVKVID